jgi:hypothetical protein
MRPGYRAVMRRILGVGLLVMLGGCQNKFAGNVQLDGTEFVAKHCENGIKVGFSGVQLDDASGRRLRVINDITTNSVKVAVFPKADGPGENLDGCTTLKQHTGTGIVNGVQNQEGTVTFTCDAGGHKLSGTLEFKNCH